jgi:hypothetical protein
MTTTATRLDLRRELKALYTAPTATPVLVEVPTGQFLMLDGAGDPATAPAYQAAVQTLYSAAYALKFALRRTVGLDLAVMPLEGLWWTNDGPRTFSYDDRSNWRWTMLIRQPSAVTPDLVAATIAAVMAKKKLPALADLRLATLDEGLAAQVLHIGSYRAEPPTIARLHAFVEQKGYHLHGKHHEIYLNDPQRTDPSKLRTILRHPIRRAVP